MEIKKQLRNIFLIKAIDFIPFLKKYIMFLWEYRYGNGKSSYPVNITLDLTYRCNLSCDFCFFKESVLNNGEINEELTLENIENLLEDVYKFRPSFFITGGEPMIRPDIIPIIKLIKSYGLRCGISTNGILITKEKAKQISDSGLDYIFLSYYGNDKTKDNLINLTKLKERPKVFMNYVLCPENLERMDSLIDYAKETKIDGIFLQHLSYLTKRDLEIDKKSCNNSSLLQEINNNSFFESKPFDDNFKLELKNKIRKFIQEAKEKKVLVDFKPKGLTDDNLTKWYSDEYSYFLGYCKYVWNVARISPTGDIYPCYQYRIIMGNIKNESFSKIWNNEKFVSFRNLLKERGGTLPACNRCCKLSS